MMSKLILCKGTRLLLLFKAHDIWSVESRKLLKLLTPVVRVEG